MADPAPSDLRKSHADAELAQIARAARVGHDDGVQHGRDYGPGLRLRAVAHRQADVVLEDGPDIDRPNETVRRARRSDPLLALRRAGSIAARDFEAAERLREELEAGQPSMPTCAGNPAGVFTAPHLRIGISELQIEACAAARLAIAAVSGVNRQAVLWVVLGGTVLGYRAYAGCRNETARGWVMAGLAELADYYSAVTPLRR